MDLVAILMVNQESVLSSVQIKYIQVAYKLVSFVDCRFLFRRGARFRLCRLSVCASVRVFDRGVYGEMMAGELGPSFIIVNTLYKLSTCSDRGRRSSMT